MVAVDEKMAEKEVDVLVLGAGPCGIGAAHRLNQNGHEDWLLMADCAEVGGLALTEETKEGFLFVSSYLIYYVLKESVLVNIL